VRQFVARHSNAGMVADGVNDAPAMEPADQGLGRSRGGWGSKLHLVS
jgi:cation transport ATPase